MARPTSNRALRVLDEWKREWAVVRDEVVFGTEPLSAPASRDVPRISEVALSICEKALEAFEGHRRHFSRDDKDQDAYTVERQADLGRLARRTLDGDFSRWENMADHVIEPRGLPIARGSAEDDDLVRALSDASVDPRRGRDTQRLDRQRLPPSKFLRRGPPN